VNSINENRKTNTTEGKKTKGLPVDRINGDTGTIENNQLSSSKTGLLKYDGFIAGVNASILIDCGASNNFINEAFVNRHKIRTEPICRTLNWTLVEIVSYAIIDFPTLRFVLVEH